MRLEIKNRKAWLEVGAEDHYLLTFKLFFYGP